MASSKAGERQTTVLRIVLLLSAALTAVPAAGQRAYQFSFSNPGARSMGFGGAFVALADDATAAFANPAGLVQIVEPEVSVEGRSWGYSTPYFSGGRLNGQPTGIGLDTEPGLLSARSSEEVAGVSFLAFVYPKGNWSLAFYRHQLANFEFASEAQGFYFEVQEGPQRSTGLRSVSSFEIVTYGVAGAWRVNDELSFGFGLASFDGDVRGRGDDYLWDENTPEARFSPISFLPERLFSGTVTTIDDQDWGLSAGFLWRFDDRWSLGGSFRQGPEFTTEIFTTVGPANPYFEPGTSGPGSFRVAYPDVYSLGVSFRSPDERLTVSLEGDLVEYSTLTESLKEGIEGLGANSRFPFDILDDALELHLGAEYIFLRSTPVLAIRWGAWLEPDHQLSIQALGSSGDDEIHLAVGLGVAFKRFQIDLGADLSDFVDTVSVSTIYSF